ncbi:O-antigen polysaccharide polymerase Wzy [Parashewanella tropica]|uniref:O-antigen polysaccharide polymerase Wzy n=1 Tax=Parashewanella tropica TaxID=2547970 RepID=UPI00105A6F08|nr:O-antigen polysaccharide polymerase Wzy [Parashewanella tropica]
MFILIVIFLSLYAFSYLFLEKADVFSYFNLLNIGFFFYLFIRPVALVYINDFNSPYTYFIEDSESYMFLTYILALCSYLFVMLGYATFKKKLKFNFNNFDSVGYKKSEDNSFSLTAKIFILFGVITQCYLIFQAGGLYKVLSSLSLRNELFISDGSFFLVSLAKSFLIIGGFYLITFYFIEKRIKSAWFVILFLFLFSASFGGRGFSFSFILGGLILSHYIYKKIKLKRLFLIFLITVPFLGAVGQFRDSLNGTDEISSSSINESIKDKLLIASKINRGFDYDTAFLYSYLNKDLSYAGKYILGISTIIPRSVYPNKSNIVASDLALDLYGIQNYAITPTLLSSVTAFWGLEFVPLFAFFSGFFGAIFWYLFVYKSSSNRYKISIYVIFWPYISVFFMDLASFLQGTILLISLLFLFYMVNFLLVSFYGSKR